MNKAFTLSIEDVLRRPLFSDAEVVSGHQGLSHSIRWVHILETPEGYSFLNGGELILSTASGFGGDSTKRLSFLLELIERKAAGLCIELGTVIAQIPQDMRELAEQHGFPLIAFNRPVHFVNITMDLHETIMFQHMQAIRDLETYAREIQQLTLETQSVTKLLHHFQKSVNTQTFFFNLDNSPLFVPSMSPVMQENFIHLLKSSILSSDSSIQEKGILSISEDKQILYQPIMAMGHALSYIGVILHDHEHEPDQLLYLTLDYTATSIAQILLRKMFAEERFLDNQQRLLDDILQDKIKHKEQIQTLLGIKNKEDRPPSYLPIILEIEQGKDYYDQQVDSPFHDLVGIFRSVLARCGFRAFILSKGYRLYLLLIENNDNFDTRKQARKAASEIEQSCKKAFGTEVSIRLGIGRISRNYSQINLHFEEAEQVMSFPQESSISFFDDLGVYRLLLQNDTFTLNSFITDYLGPILEYDAKHNSKLLLTLKVLISSGSKQEAADLLYIRRQTLYQRLEKLEGILGEDYLEPPHRICLELAICAYDWINKENKTH
ncbi:PucR family transcriptional regulator [Peribacillus sp. NPDC060186]